MKNIILSLLILTYVLSSTAQQYDLKLNLKKGQHYKQSMVTDMKLNQSVGGQEMTINTKMQFEFTQSVKSINAKGEFELENEYSRIIVTMDVMGQNISYDSDKKDEPGTEVSKMLSGPFSKIIGKKFLVVLTPKGKVVEIKGFKQIIETLSKGSSDPNSKKMIEEMLDEHKLSSSFESSYHMFPENSVKVGESWSQRNTIETMFPVDIATTYTLKEVNNGVAKIIMTGDFTIKKDDYESKGLTMKINFSGKYNGFYDVDINSGISNRVELNMPMTGTMELMGMEVPCTVNSTITTTNTLQN